MCFDSTLARGNVLISLMGSLAILGICGIAISSVTAPSIRARRLRHESERFALFLSEVVTRSTYSLEPLLASLSSGILRVDISGETAQTFTPRRGMTLDIPGALPTSSREVRHGRSCSPTTFLITGEATPLQCTTTLSLRCRVRTTCSARRRT